MSKSRYINNIEKLYYGNKEEVLEALNEKKIWIDRVYYVPGNLDFLLDENGKKHYLQIESVYSGALLFNKPSFKELNFNDEIKEVLIKLTEDFRVLKLDDDINTTNDFYFEYNFSLLDLSSFKILFPNFFKGITLSELNESFDFKNIDVCDAIKCLIYSKTLQNSIILSKNQLINDCFPCNVLTKIYVKNTAKNDLKLTLIEIAKKFKIEVEEY